MKILVADDDPLNLVLVKSVLSALGQEIDLVGSGTEAWTAIEGNTYDLLLLDVMMPDMNGYDLTRRLRQEPRHRDVPVLFLTALGTKNDLLAAFEAGATDYITKPFHNTELIHRVKAHLRLRALQVRMEFVVNNLNRQILENEAGRLALAEKERQLTEANRLLAEANRTLLDHASRDALTGLLNRRKGWDYMNYEEEKARRTKRPIGVALLDIDKFKSVNDNFGHEVGDHVLKATSECLAASLRASDILVRWGGEEFLMVFPETDAEHLVLVAEKVRRRVEAAPWDLPGGRRITVSIGVVVKDPDLGWERTLDVADRALYQAKEKGRNRVYLAKRRPEGPTPTGS